MLEQDLEESCQPTQCEKQFCSQCRHGQVISHGGYWSWVNATGTVGFTRTSWRSVKRGLFMSTLIEMLYVTSCQLTQSLKVVFYITRSSYKRQSLGNQLRFSTRLIALSHYSQTKNIGSGWPRKIVQSFPPSGHQFQFSSKSWGWMAQSTWLMEFFHLYSTYSMSIVSKVSFHPEGYLIAYAKWVGWAPV